VQRSRQQDTSSPFHCRTSVARGTIVVVSAAAGPQEVPVMKKKVFLGLDYGTEWDYIYTCELD